MSQDLYKQIFKVAPRSGPNLNVCLYESDNGQLSQWMYRVPGYPPLRAITSVIPSGSKKFTFEELKELAQQDAAQCLTLEIIDRSEEDTALELAFVDAVGQENYQKLLNEGWLPFHGSLHEKLEFATAVANEVKEAQEFLASLVQTS